MKDRLRELIRYKTGGKHKDFAALIGWKPQYLAKLVRGDDFGLKPVLALLAALPEVNARWFLFGQGEMLVDESTLNDLRRETASHIQAVLDLERFVSVMSPDELRLYAQMVNGHKQPDFSQETRARWIARLADRQQAVDARFRTALKQSEETLCRQKIASE